MTSMSHIHDWSDAFEPTNHVEDFLSDQPPFLNKATICNELFTCQLKGGKPIWVKTDKNEKDTKGVVEKCRVDSLIAAAKATGTCRAPHNAPERCKNATVPVLTSEKDKSFYSYYSEDPVITRLPNVLDASLECVDDNITRKTHKMVSKINLGDLGRYEFSENMNRKSVSKPPKNNVSASPVLEAISEKVVKQSTEQPNTPPLIADKKIELPPTNKSESQPEEKTPPAPTPEKLSPTPSIADSKNWHRCSWFSNEAASLACSKDADCPLVGDAAFDVWFDASVMTEFTGDKQKIGKFIEKVNNRSSRNKIP